MSKTKNDMNIDELIEKYENNINNHLDKGGKRGSIQVREWRYIIKDLEQLKAELNEQHKKDVVKAWTSGKESVINFEIKTCTSSAEQYYNQNH